VTLTQSFGKILFCSKTSSQISPFYFFGERVATHVSSDHSFNGLEQNCCQQSRNLSEEAPHYLLLYNIEKENTELDTKTGYQCMYIGPLHAHFVPAGNGHNSPFEISLMKMLYLMGSFRHKFWQVPNKLDLARKNCQIFWTIPCESAWGSGHMYALLDYYLYLTSLELICFMPLVEGSVLSGSLSSLWPT